MKSTPPIKRKIGVSSCLPGNKVRYDGDHQFRKEVADLSEQYELIPFCPEVDIGLGVPREKIQLQVINGEVRCLDFNTRQIDYTQKLIDSCDRQTAWLLQLSGYIFKSKSPSCGISRVKTDYQGEIRADGQGIFMRRLAERLPQLPMIEEDELADKVRRKTFLSRVEGYAALRE